jgi:hypothetical protein
MCTQYLYELDCGHRRNGPVYPCKDDKCTTIKQAAKLQNETCARCLKRKRKDRFWETMECLVLFHSDKYRVRLWAALSILNFTAMQHDGPLLTWGNLYNDAKWTPMQFCWCGGDAGLPLAGSGSGQGGLFMCGPTLENGAVEETK